MVAAQTFSACKDILYILFIGIPVITNRALDLFYEFR